MSWIVLWFALQAGLSPSSDVVSYSPYNVSVYDQTGYVELTTELRLFDGHVFVGGEIRTEVQKFADNPTFLPELSLYTFTTGVRFGGLEVGAFYTCQHPTVPFYDVYRPVINWDGNWFEVYAKISGEAKVF